MIPFIDIGIVERIVCVEVGMGASVRIETDKGVFYDGNERTFYQSCLYAMEGVSTPSGVPAFGLSRSMSFCGSMAAMDQRYAELKAGCEIPLMTDDEGWRFMLGHEFPAFARATWEMYEEARWIDVDGNAVSPPDWFRSYWVKLLYHRQDEWHRKS